MRVATCTVNVRPESEVYLLGYLSAQREKPAEGVHDDPVSVLLLMEIENELLLFVSLDVVTLAKQKIDSLKKRIKEVLPLDEEHIIVSAIHSHSAPNGFDEPGIMYKGDNLQYYELVTQRIVSSLAQLQDSLQEVEAYIATTKIHGFYSNRNDRNKPFNDDASIIKFMKEGNVVAAMCNINCHATVVGPQNRMITGDLLGNVRELVGDKLGVIPYTFTGASADISNRQYRQGNDFEELERVGKGVATQLNAMDNYEVMALEPMHLHTVKYHISYDNKRYYAQYQKQLEEVDELLAADRLSFDEHKLRVSERSALQDKLTKDIVDFCVDCTILHLGVMSIVTFPGELAGKFGLELKQRCKSKYFLFIGYANDYQGYFIEQEEYGKSYETIASYTPCGESEKLIAKVGDEL